MFLRRSDMRKRPRPAAVAERVTELQKMRQHVPLRVVNGDFYIVRALGDHLRPPVPGLTANALRRRPFELRRGLISDLFRDVLHHDSEIVRILRKCLIHGAGELFNADFPVAHRPTAFRYLVCKRIVWP